MPTVTISQAITTRKSAQSRQRTLKGTRCRWSRSRNPSHLMACGDTFQDEVNEIERIYDGMIDRIDNATVNL